MKKIFYTGITAFALFELANVYFIMPMPGGSQEINSIDLAYALHSWRWIFRGLFALLIVLGLRAAFQSNKWVPTALLMLLSGLVYMTNFFMAADIMFYQPKTLFIEDLNNNQVEQDRLIIGITHKGEAKAYPIQYLGYHHQVRDSIGGQPIMVTYCTVCRTGRVFEPIVEGKIEEFRLVGMDHFNAMFEDKTTKSWWRQVTGEAIAGRMKGRFLPEFPSMQTTLSKWVELYPHSKVMQPDPHFQVEYDSMQTYEKGKLTGKLTRRDTASWQKKSWVVGVEIGSLSKAYDWNLLQKEQIIYDVINEVPIAVVLSKDSSSFVVLERTSKEQVFIVTNDTLKDEENAYNLAGISIKEHKGGHLNRINASQEYWHSWQTFHPLTQKYEK